MIAEQTKYDTRHGGPYDRGSADSYYNRERQPHYGGVNGCPRITTLTVKEIEGYNAGYEDHELFGVKKTYDSLFELNLFHYQVRKSLKMEYN